MRDRHGLLRLHRFRTEECRRQVADIEMMVADLMRKYDELDAHVKYEEGRNGINDPGNINYSMAAKATRVRRDNLLKSIGDLKDQQALAQSQLEDQERELRKVELLVEKEGGSLNPPAPVTSPSMTGAMIR
jgi:hypothetical protein